MARYEGRHRNAPAPSTALRPNPATSSARSGATRHEAAPELSEAAAVPRSPRPVAQAAGVGKDAAARLAASTQSPSGRRHGKSPARKRHVARPFLAGALAVGLGASGFAYAKANNLIGADNAAFVVGNGVVAQTDEMARAATVDMSYRAAASVSRNERRTAIFLFGVTAATELEAKKKQEAAKQAVLAREAA